MNHQHHRGQMLRAPWKPGGPQTTSRWQQRPQPQKPSARRQVATISSTYVDVRCVSHISSPRPRPRGGEEICSPLAPAITTRWNGGGGSCDLSCPLRSPLPCPFHSYVQLAVRLGRDSRYRRWVSDLMDQRSPALWERRGVVLEWARFLSRAGGRAPPADREVKPQYSGV